VDRLWFFLLVQQEGQDGEENRHHGESKHLDVLTAELIHQERRNPVARERNAEDNGVMRGGGSHVGILRPDGLGHNRGKERVAVKDNVKQEPAACCPEQLWPIFSTAEVRPKGRLSCWILHNVGRLRDLEREEKDAREGANQKRKPPVQVVGAVGALSSVSRYVWVLQHEVWSKLRRHHRVCAVWGRVVLKRVVLKAAVWWGCGAAVGAVAEVNGAVFVDCAEDHDHNRAEQEANALRGEHQ